jgi:hypothetical protein
VTSLNEYERVLSLAERIREPAFALLLLNIVLFADVVVVSTKSLTLTPIPTPWGNASFVLGVILILISFAVFNWVVASVQQLLTVWLAPWLGRGTELSVEEKRDMVDIWVLDTYLNVRDDEALKRAYSKQKRVVDDLNTVKENSAVTLALFLILWWIPDSLTKAVLTDLQWIVPIVVIAGVLLAFAALVPASDGFYKVYLPGKGNQIYESVYRERVQAKRPTALDKGTYHSEDTQKSTDT